MSPFGCRKIYTADAWVAIDPPSGRGFKGGGREKAGMANGTHPTQPTHDNGLKSKTKFHTG